MAETFDPLQFRGGPDVVQALKGMGISISQRVGARLYFLGKKDVQLSPALLEGASAGTAVERLLLHDGWAHVAGAQDQERVRALVAGDSELTSLVAVEREGGILKLVLPEEREFQGEEGAPREEASRGSLLPMVMGPSSPMGFRGTLWDRRRLEESALIFLDAEDTEEILENFRHLFRAAITTRQDPMPLLISALHREKLPLSREVAAMIKEYLNRDMGRALQDLFSEEAPRMADALHSLLRGSSPLEREILPIVLFPALTGMVKNPANLPFVLPSLRDLVPFVGRNVTALDAFLDALLQGVHRMGAEDLNHVSGFLIAIQDAHPGAVAFLKTRLTGTPDPHLIAFYGNILSRMAIGDDDKREVTLFLVETFLHHGRDVVLQERLRATFLNLYPISFTLLGSGEHRVKMTESQHVFFLELVETFLEDGHAPPDGDLGAILAGELLERSRAVLLSMSRSGLLLHRSLIAAIKERDVLLPVVVKYLSEELRHLEEPDDEPVIRFLAELGGGVFRELHERLLEEVALGSKALPFHFRLFAKTASFTGEAGAPALHAMAQDALSLPFLREPPHPFTIEGLGYLARIPRLPQEQVEHILEIILSAPDTLAPVKMKAAVEVYRSASTRDETRQLLESRLLDIVRSAEPGRRTLAASLEALKAIAELPGAPHACEDIAATLARKVLEKSRETSLQYVLSEALRDGDEGSGVRMPLPWGREDRDMALVVLGKLGSHPALSPELKRKVTARLFSFLDDWLDAQQRKNELYLHRETPLWNVLMDMMTRAPLPEFFTLARQAGLRLLEVHRRSPETLQLAKREDAQRFVVHLLKTGSDSSADASGLPVSMEKSLLSLLLELAAEENPMTLYMLGELQRSGALTAELQAQLELFLSLQKKKE